MPTEIGSRFPQGLDRAPGVYIGKINQGRVDMPSQPSHCAKRLNGETENSFQLLIIGLTLISPNSGYFTPYLRLCDTALSGVTPDMGNQFFGVAYRDGMHDAGFSAVSNAR